MSKERETLITDLSINAVDGFFYITQKLQAEIRELLTQKREPLTPQQISEGNQSMFNVTREAFKQGVKFAEDMHGIGGGE